MDVYEALYTTRMMRRMRPDAIPLDAQSRILDAAVRAPNGGNAQRWHFLVVDDLTTKERLVEIYRRCRAREYGEITAGTLARTLHKSGTGHAETLRKIKSSGDHFVEH